MDHFIDFLNRKRLPVGEMLINTACQITEKVDGTALQSYYDYDTDTLTFGKRGDSYKKQSRNPLTFFDRVLNPTYDKVVSYLMEYTDILKQYKILNFEIFSENDNHIIKYHGKFKNNIVLLSGFNHQGGELSSNELKSLSVALNISVRQLLYEGAFNATQVDIICRYKDNLSGLWQYLCGLCKIDSTRNDIEGFVLNFYELKRVLKVQNPTFKKTLMDHLNSENFDKQENLENLYEYIISLSKHVKTKKQYICKLLDLYFQFEKMTEKDEAEKTENILKNCSVLQNIRINILLLRKVYDIPIKSIKYEYVCKFILLGFHTKRTKTPLWCSNEYQQKVNNFIENFNK